MQQIISPKISVILPAYNASKYIVEAIESILSQSFSDFELLVINDGSTDDTEEKILSISDDRIKYIKNEQNIGLANTLNKGMNLANGEYIARMDADDISLPTRFQVQVDFLDNNKDFILCSTAIKTFGAGEEKVIMATSCNEQLKIDLLFSSNVAHPAVMFRRKEFIENSLYYKQEECPAEDYALWTRVIFVGKIYNIPEVLLHYRIHPSQVTARIDYKTKDKIKLIRTRYVKSILSSFDDKHLSVFVDLNVRSYSELKLLGEVFVKIAACDFLEEKKVRHTLKRYYQSCAFDLLTSDKSLMKKQKFELFFSLRLRLQVKLVIRCIRNCSL